MTRQTTTTTSVIPDDRTGPDGAVLDTEQLVAALFDRFTAAQLDLLRARATRDRRTADERLLAMRAAGLLLACIPAHPDGKGFRLKTLIAVAFREEDGQEASHAWLMVERALLLDQQRHPAPPPRD